MSNLMISQKLGISSTGVNYFTKVDKFDDIIREYNKEIVLVEKKIAKLDESDVHRVCRLIVEGNSGNEVGRKTSLSYRLIRECFRRVNNDCSAWICQKSGGGVNKDAILELHSQGYPCIDISKRLGIDTNAIKRFLDMEEFALIFEGYREEYKKRKLEHFYQNKPFSVSEDEDRDEENIDCGRPSKKLAAHDSMISTENTTVIPELFNERMDEETDVNPETTHESTSNTTLIPKLLDDAELLDDTVLFEFLLNDGVNVETVVDEDVLFYNHHFPPHGYLDSILF